MGVLSAPALAQWDPLAGIKTGSGNEIESSSLYVGPQLQVLGGTLDFLGDATISGPVLLEEQNGWGAPIVTVAGTFNMNGPSFRVLNGAMFIVNGADPGTVSTGILEIAGGSQAQLGTVSASDNVSLRQSASLSVLGDFTQTGGEFTMFEGPTSFQTGGSFNYTGLRFGISDGASFSVGNAAASSITTALLDIGGTSQVTVGTVSASDNVSLRQSASLSVLGDFTQTGGEFTMFQGPTSFQTGGSFNYTGLRFGISDGASFSVGNAAASSIDALELFLGDSQLNIQTVNVATLAAVTGANGRWDVRDGGTATVGAVLVLSELATVDVSHAGRMELGLVSAPAASGQIRIGSGGTLAGSGTVIGDIFVESGGTITPGLSPGAMQANGAFEMLAGASLVLEITGSDPAEFDSLTITGDAVFGGALLLQFAPGYVPAPGSAFPLISWGGALEGAFDSVMVTGIDPSLVVPSVEDGLFVVQIVPTPPTAAVLATLWCLAPRTRRRVGRSKAVNS